MKFYKLLSDYDTHKAGDVIELDPANATTKFLLSHGHIEEASTAASELEERVTERLRKAIAPTLEKVAADAAEKAADAVASGVERSFRMPAEAKDHGTLGEYLQALAYTASPQLGGLYQKAVNILVNKFGLNPNPGFDEEYRKSIENGGFVEKGLGTTRKAPAALSETSGSLGSFGVPVQFFPEIIKLVGERSALYPRVRKYTMSGLEMDIPALDYTQGGSGNSPYNAGMVANWGAEGVGFNQTNPKIRQIKLKANLLTGYTIASRTLLADNQIGLQQVLTELIGDTIAYYVDYAILNGTGDGQPLGIQKSAVALGVTRTAAGDGALLTDVGNMAGKLLPESDNKSCWMLAPSTKGTLFTMNDASGRVVYLPIMPNTSGGPATTALPLMLDGKPVIVSQLPASNGTAGDLWLIDPEQYAFGLRQEIEIGVSEHVNFLSNQLTWRFIFRGDGQPRLNAAVTLQNGDQVSPFVYRS